MNHKRLGSLAVLLILLAFPASASMVSFLLVETGLDEGAPHTELTSVWEGGLMDAFFNAGHIVTNSPITRMRNRPSRDLSGFIENDFNEAALNGAEYYILGFLEYQAQGGRPVPVGVALRVYTISSQRLIHEQSFPAGTGRNLNEEYRLAQNAGRIIISHIN